MKFIKIFKFINLTISNHFLKNYKYLFFKKTKIIKFYGF